MQALRLRGSQDEQVREAPLRTFRREPTRSPDVDIGECYLYGGRAS